MHPLPQPFKSSDLSQAIRLKLGNLIGSYPGNKCLYVEDTILKLLNFVFELRFSDFMAKESIQEVFSFKFEDEKEEIIDESNSEVIVFFLTPQVKWMRKVAEMILNNKAKNIQKQYLLLLTPKKSFLCLNELEALQVKGLLRVESLNFGLVPMSADTLSLEIPKSFVKLFGKSDQTVLQVVAESILKLQYALGDFEQILGKGDLSNTVIQLVKEKDTDENYEHHESPYSLSLIVIDRSVDLVTPMLTPFSYEGMLDNFYSINFNQIFLPNDVLDPSADSNLTPYQLYNSLDETYSTITSTSIYNLEEPLKNKSSTYKTVLQNAKKNQDLRLEDLNTIMENQGRQYLFLQHHTMLLYSLFKKTKSLIFEKSVTMENQMIQTGSVLLENMDELAAFLEPRDWFRLVCVASAVHGGIKEKTIKAIEETACRMYGIEHAFTIKNMFQCGLLSSFTKTNWKEVKERFRLINEEEDSSKMTQDYSYIYILYASLLARMVEEGLRSSGQAWKDPKYDLLKGKTTVISNSQANFARTTKPKLCFVYILGGVSYGEISSLREVSKNLKQQLVICSTRVSGSKGIVEECFEF